MSEPDPAPVGDPVTPGELDLMAESARLRREGQAKIKHALELWNQFRLARTAQLQQDCAPFLDRMLLAVKPLIEAHEADQDEAFRAYQRVRDTVTAEVEERTRQLREEHVRRMAEVNAGRPTCSECGSTRLVPGGCLSCMYLNRPAVPKQPRPRRVQS